MDWKQAGNEILQILENNGFEAYIVGGAVRDQLLNRPLNDTDVVTSASIEQIRQLFSRTIEVGIQHGTVIVPVKGLPVEVSTFKGKTITDDLLNRDFTINAMAKTVDGKIIDPGGGRKDLAEGVIRTVRSSASPLTDDPLRLLRALRFALQLDFKIEEETSVYLSRCAHLISEPAVERLARESEKISHCRIDGEDWEWLFNEPVFRRLPYFFKHKPLQQALKGQSAPVVFNDYLTWWAFAVFSEEREYAQQALSYYKRSNRLKNDIKVVHKAVHRFFDRQWQEWDVYELGRHRLGIAVKLVSLLSEQDVSEMNWQRVYEALAIKHKKELDVSGRDILNRFQSFSGWQTGQWMKKVERAVVTNRLPNDKEMILNWLEKEAKK